MLQIKEINPSYLDELEYFGKNLDSQSTHFFRPHKFDKETIKSILKKDKNLSFMAFSGNNIPIAYFFLWNIDTDYPMLGIGILADFQNKGYGHKLLDFLIDKAKSLNRKGIELTCTLGNERAFHIYNKKGFVHYEDRRDILYDGSEIIERAMKLDF